jgi:ribosomal protein L11 methyltransferase
VGPLVGGVELRDVGTLLPTAPGRTAVVALCKPGDRRSVLSTAQQALSTAREAGLGVDPVVVRERNADETEWRDVWKQFFRTTRVGRKFSVRPSWDPAGPQDVEFTIDLDPGRAFGTGAHPSTRLVIELAEDLQEDEAAVTRFLDLGCGSGILSIAAARLWPAASGLAVDNDADATACSQENFERNGVSNVALLTGTLELAEGTFEVILANLQADVLCDLAPLAAERVTAGGHIILSGILHDQADEVAAAFSRAGFALRSRRDESEWSALLLQKAAARPRVRMARIFVKPEQLTGDRITLDAAAHRHLIRVLRLSAGAAIRMFDGRGVEVDARIERVAKASLEVSLGQRRRLSVPACDITLMQSAPRGERMDLIVQKTTELGVTRIVPVLTQHATMKPTPSRRRRWQTIAAEAARQSGRADVPVIEEALPLAAALARFASPEASRFLLWEDERSRPLFRAIAPGVRRVILLVGPEGGFAPAEVEACARAGFASVGLGPRILRSETAAIVAVALAQGAGGGLE